MTTSSVAELQAAFLHPMNQALLASATAIEVMMAHPDMTVSQRACDPSRNQKLRGELETKVLACLGRRCAMTSLGDMNEEAVRVLVPLVVAKALQTQGVAAMAPSAMPQFQSV